MVETQSKEMKSEDLKKLTDVIDNLLQFEDLEESPTSEIDDMTLPNDNVSIENN